MQTAPSSTHTLVLARIENSGFRATGRMIRPDGVNYIAETEPCPEAKVLVWSADPTRWEEGEKWAAANGYQCVYAEDTEDVLDRVRKSVLAEAA